MRYEIFGKPENEPQPGETDQAYMERIMRAFCVPDPDAHGINEMMGPDFVSCRASEPELVLRFHTRDWMLNSHGVMQGGVLSIAMDMGMGTLARFIRHQNYSVTMQMSVDFMRPVQAGEDILVRARLEKGGKRVLFLTSEAWPEAAGEEQAAARITALFA